MSVQANIGPIPTPNDFLYGNPGAAGESILSGFSGLSQGFQNTIGNRGFWIRTGTVVGGVALIWVGILIMLAANKTVRTVAVDAAKTAAVA